MTTAQLQEKQVEEIRPNRTIHEMVCGVAYYNHEGIHWRVFKSFSDAKAYVLDDDETKEILFETEEETELDQWFEDTDICSTCGDVYDFEIEGRIDELGDVCCTDCCYYDEVDGVYRKGDRLSYGLSKFAEDDECPYCGCSDFDVLDENYSDNTHYIVYKCNDCEEEWTARHTLDKVYTDDGSEHYIKNEHEELLISENKAMGDFLEKQLGFTQENVSDIANSGSKLYRVHVVCNNELESYKLFTKIEEAHASYIALCKEWYSDDGLEAFASAVEYDSEVEHYDGYYDSLEYNDACDNAHVSWEVLNG